jgi:uncharacterized repeat protein (TIGR01451 family)
MGWAAVILALFAATVVHAQDTRPEVTVTSDAYGHLVVDQDDRRCGFEFIDISVDGQAVWFTASGSAAAEDDGGAVVRLEAPFELYGVSLPAVVMSTNGYLAGAAALAVDSGGDFTNDATLPAIPDNTPGVAGRLFVYHSDLNGVDVAGEAYSLFSDDCPRPSEALGSEPCTILQWSDWSRADGDGLVDLQAVLYHSSFEVVYQIRPGTGLLTGGTIGMQDSRGADATQYRPGSAGLSGDTAVCLFEPRFPSGGRVADLVMLNSDKVDGIGPGAQVTYAVSLINRGPSPVVGAAVRDALPADLVNCSWTCESSPGSRCDPTGTGSIDTSADIESGGWVDYWLTCQIAISRGQVVTTASVTAPPDVEDPDMTNNSSTDVTRILNDPWVCRRPMSTRGLVWPAQPTDEPQCGLGRWGRWGQVLNRSVL